MNSWVLLQRLDSADDPGCHILALSQKLSPLIPHAIIRELLHQMDNCCGTNKNQYVYGGPSLLVALGILDAITVEFMKVGHTKFEPDMTARHTAGSFNRNDVYNPGMWNDICQQYASSCFYDGSMLRTWKESTVELFRPVDHITRYRSFLFLADDGELDMLPMEIDEGQGHTLLQTYLQKDKGVFYSHESLMAEVVKLKGRSMP